MADERTTDETSASSDALLVGGSSASPSPTPTFAGTGRPQRRARRLRWQAGIPRSALVLSAFSCALLLAGVVNYAFAVPGMLYKPAVTPLNPMSLILAASASDDGGLAGTAGSSTQARAVGPVAATGAQAQAAGASAALGLGSSSSALGATSLVTGVSAVDSSFAKAVEAARENESAKPDSATGSNANSGTSAVARPTAGPRRAVRLLAALPQVARPIPRAVPAPALSLRPPLNLRVQARRRKPRFTRSLLNI